MKLCILFWRTGILLCAAALPACARTDVMRWKEQIWLHDGKLIHVDRYAERISSGFPNTRRGRILLQELEYKPLDVKWRTDGVLEETISFDVINGIPYLVVVGSNKEMCANKRVGDYAARFYTWRAGKKMEVSQQSAPVDVMYVNLTGESQWGIDHSRDKAYISWRDVRGNTGQPLDGPPQLLTDMFKKSPWLICR